MTNSVSGFSAALYKDDPGKASVAFTNLAMADSGDHITYQAAKGSRYWDKDETLTIKSDGVAVTSGFAVNYLRGSVTFETSMSGHTITATGKRRSETNFTKILLVYDGKLRIDDRAIDTTSIDDAGWSNSIAGRRGWEMSAGAFYYSGEADLPDVGDRLIWKIYNIYSLVARPGHIQATGGGGSTLTGNSPNLGIWETFTVIDLGAGKVALKCYDGVHYVAAVGGGGGVVNAESTSASIWETFTLVDMGSGKIALKCFDDTHYVGLTDANGTNIYAESTHPGVWETFTPIDMSPGTIFQSYAIVDYLDSVTNDGHIDAPVGLAVSSSSFWASNLSLRIGYVEMDRYILLLESGLGHDLFELNARGQVTHSWEADFTQTLGELSERVHGKTSGGSISGGALTLDNSDYFMIPFYGPLPLSGDPGAAWIEVVLSAITGDEATVQIAKETDLSDMVAVEHDALVMGTNKIFIPDLMGEDHVAIGLKAGASGSISITGLSAAVKRYVAPSTIPAIKRDETATIVVGYTAGRLISAAATVNDRFWY